jgi:hypothetical protein
MNSPLSIEATLTNGRSQSKEADRPIALWILVVVLVAIACTVLALDAAITTDQRIAQFVQSGMFP